MPKDFNYIHEETEEILGAVPPRTIIYGNLVIFGVMVIILAIGCMIRYKDVIHAPVKIYLLPNGTYYGEALVSPKGFGNIQISQKVNVSSDCFPSAQYGYLEGRVNEMDSVMSGDVYKVGITIPHIKTNYNIKLRPIKEMSGNADIVISDHFLIHKVMKFIKI